MAAAFVGCIRRPPFRGDERAFLRTTEPVRILPVLRFTCAASPRPRSGLAQANSRG